MGSGNIISGSQPEVAAATSKSPDSGPSPSGNKRSLPKSGEKGSKSNSAGNSGKKYKVWAWGSTGEEKWNVDLEIGIDWKSLIRSALLPITTDFFPDGHTLQTQFVVFQYCVDCSELDSQTYRYGLYERDGSSSPTEEPPSSLPSQGFRRVKDRERRPSMTWLIYQQLILQRLQRGYQIVLLDKNLVDLSCDVMKIQRVGGAEKLSGGQNVERKYREEKRDERLRPHEPEIVLSFNKYYHKLNMDEERQQVYVTTFKPRETMPAEVDGFPGWYERPSVKEETQKMAPFPPNATDDVLNARYYNTFYTYYFQVQS